VDPRSAMDPALKEDFRREVDILSEVRHPNVVLLMGVCLKPNPQTRTNLCSVLEWYQWGSPYCLWVFFITGVSAGHEPVHCVGVVSGGLPL
jgi:serine/threonine protein kinase